MSQIYLEPQEEITTVIDKIKTLSTKEEDVILVAPDNCPLTASIINLKLLAKETKSLDKKLILVTTDTISRNLAGRLGIPVLASVKDVNIMGEENFSEPTAPQPLKEIIHLETPEELKREEKTKLDKNIHIHRYEQPLANDERRVEKEQSPPAASPIPPVSKKNKKRLILAFGIIVLLILVNLFLFSPAKVNLYIASEPLAQNVNLALAGEKLNSTQEISEKFSATGEKEMGEKATGSVTIYNYWDSTNQDISANSVFIKDGKNFYSQQAVSVPGTTIKQGNQVPGTATVTVVAETNGGDYNLAAGRFTITSLPTNKQAQIYAQSALAFTNGSSKKVKIISEDDIARAKQQLSDKLTDKVKEDLNKQAADKNKEILIKAINQQLSSAAADKKAGSQADDFQMTLSATAVVLAFDSQVMRQAVFDNLKTTLPKDKELILDASDETTIDIESQDWEKEELKIAGQVKTRIAPKIDQAELKKKLAGNFTGRGAAFLANTAGYKKADVKIQPTFWLTFPLWTKMINLTIHYE
ncbi:MAG: Uncharacterized protein CEN88_339 [Candidatus Berkelbacteria bacterium Licking1014_2]|uniref:Baseplate protein J-like domain-containing protein n=1 Tax=Candidatus Berkelbacteria bacterium Licking1014_2 TaxID=2017146 RepID=A0A554LUF5_9BACT|nr:MAG: Uncharacterized protein CEN88_339 [Candidatus Berkelbacteria bacterium Licking1014_2]